MRLLEHERDILQEAVAFFAMESERCDDCFPLQADVRRFLEAIRGRSNDVWLSVAASVWRAAFRDSAVQMVAAR